MEAKVNDTGYAALKQLDQSGDLRFELRFVGYTFVIPLTSLT